MNSFVTLRDIDMFSKRHMFKIKPTFPQEYFHVRAGECARYILHHFQRNGCEKLNIFHCFLGGLKLCIFSLFQEI